MYENYHRDDMQSGKVDIMRKSLNPLRKAHSFW